MKVALVHDYLNQYGGGERVLEALMEMFPDAPVYTLMYDEQAMRGRFRGRVRGTSFLDFPFARRHHRLFIPLMPLAVRAMTLDDHYDLIISDSAGFAKGMARIRRIRPIGRIKPMRHISYIHTPLRYVWEQKEYLSGLISHFSLLIARPLLNYLKHWDYRAGQKPDALIANSKFIAEKIRRYYGREAEVIYPPVDTAKFCFAADSRGLDAPARRSTGEGGDERGQYYLAVGRLLHYKRFDLVIDAFEKLRKEPAFARAPAGKQMANSKLLIVGEGPEKEKLERQTANRKNIELLPFIENEDELRRLYAGARALLFPQVEDFGLVAAEALACGTPVIAYAAGGAREMIEDGQDGVLFHEQTAEALAAAVRKFETMTFDRAAIARRAARFSKERFVKEFTKAIESLTTRTTRTTRTITNNTNYHEQHEQHELSRTTRTITNNTNNTNYHEQHELGRNDANVV